ncbi:MAG: PLxRFG domain-containing protein, partial [Nitrosarchaeum sp.]|nr:PLxRFG domain-containing protein [Nitrosarchaeum sp.]
WLGARYGYGKSAKALMQAYRDFFDPKTLNKDTVFDASKSLNLTADERTFLLIAIEAGKIDVTQTMDLAGMASQDNLSRKAKAVGTVQDKIMRMLAFSFHIPEVMNRQVTALAAYRLAKAALLQNRGTNTDEQIEQHARVQGIKSLDDTHFIYAAENRPRIMQGNVMRVLTMFKQYGQAVVFTYGNAARLWLERNKPDGMTPEQEREERRVARSQLLSMLSFQFAAAGALGLPFVGSIVGLLTAAANGFGDDDEDKDWQAEFRKSLAASIGKNSAEVVAHGLSRLTPYDMAGRLGQESLFFRTPSREREGRAAFTDWALSLGGPVAGYGINAWLGIPDVLKGIKDLDAGHFLRGTEELTPALVRNVIKTFRYELEGGIRTRDHYKQMDVTFAEELGQFFGFAPRRGAEMYEGVTDIKNAEHRLATRRNDLLDLYALARSEADPVKLQGAIADIREFNGRHPNMRINGDTIMRSLRGRFRREQLMDEGIYLPRNRAFLRQEGSYANY